MRNFAARIIIAWVLVLAPFGTLRAEKDLVGLYLTWKSDPTTSMVVNWVNLYEHTSTRVWYKAAGENDWVRREGTRQTVRPSVYQVRRVELTGLRPDTVYRFAIGESPPADGKTGVEHFRTLPRTLDDRPVRFVSGGDMMHRRDWLDAMNRVAGAQDPDFALIGGDLAYANGVDATRWVDWFQSCYKTLRGPDQRLIPMVVAIGNHEVRGHYKGRIPDDAPYFYGFFDLPENRSYHALDFGGYLSLLVLDTNHTQPVVGAQTRWLSSALDARRDRRFIFPCYHFPAYGSGKRAPNGGLPSEHPHAVTIRREWSPLFERHQVTGVFENDHHAYKRTHPILAGERDDERGIVYLGDGAWGVVVRSVLTPDEVWYLAKSEARRHLFVVTLPSEGDAVVRALDAKGVEFDACTLAPRDRR